MRAAYSTQNVISPGKISQWGVGRPCSVRCLPARPLRRKVAATGEDGDDLDAMFKRELEKRKISSVDDIKDVAERRPSPSGRRAFASPPPPPPPFVGDDQLARSRQLNSEGLEGLIPRATQLVGLGVSFFLAFGPFIIAVGLAFGAIYTVFGDDFIHTGRPSSSMPTVGTSTYINPDDLLNAPTVDPMIPM